MCQPFSWQGIDALLGAKKFISYLNFSIEDLNKERGIWWKGDQSILEETVTVQFTDHFLEDGIKRILASMNYCLVFDSDGALVGAILIDREKGGLASVQYTATFCPAAFIRTISTSILFIDIYAFMFTL